MMTVRAPEYALYPDRKWSWQKWRIAGVVILAVAALAVIASRHFGARPLVEPTAQSVDQRAVQLRDAAANEMDLLQLERDALQDEVTRLSAQNAAQAKRIQKLELAIADRNRPDNCP